MVGRFKLLIKAKLVLCLFLSTKVQFYTQPQRGMQNFNPSKPDHTPCFFFFFFFGPLESRMTKSNPLLCRSQIIYLVSFGHVSQA